MNTLLDFNAKHNGTVEITYIDRLGKILIITKNIDEVFTEDLKTSVEVYLSDETKIPPSKDNVKFIKVENGAFAISGEILPLKLQVINNLSIDDKAIYDAFNDFIISYTGSPIISLMSQLGTGKVEINNIVYDSNSSPSYQDIYLASNNTMREATLMSIKIFNQ